MNLFSNETDRVNIFRIKEIILYGMWSDWICMNHIDCGMCTKQYFFMNIMHRVAVLQKEVGK